MTRTPAATLPAAEQNAQKDFPRQQPRAPHPHFRTKCSDEDQAVAEALRSEHDQTARRFGLTLLMTILLGAGGLGGSLAYVSFPARTRPMSQQEWWSQLPGLAPTGNWTLLASAAITVSITLVLASVVQERSNGEARSRSVDTVVRTVWLNSLAWVWCSGSGVLLVMITAMVPRETGSIGLYAALGAGTLLCCTLSTINGPSRTSRHRSLVSLRAAQGRLQQWVREQEKESWLRAYRAPGLIYTCLSVALLLPLVAALMHHQVSFVRAAATALALSPLVASLLMMTLSIALTPGRSAVTNPADAGMGFWQSYIALAVGFYIALLAAVPLALSGAGDIWFLYVALLVLTPWAVSRLSLRRSWARRVGVREGIQALERVQRQITFHEHALADISAEHHERMQLHAPGVQS